MTLDSRMLKLIIVLSLTFLFDSSVAKVYSKCELVTELINSYNETVESSRRLVCIAEYSSGFNTDFYFDNSYGIFNLSIEFTELCSISTYYLLDEYIDDDLTCAKTIFQLNNPSSENDYCAISTEYSIDECEGSSLNTVASYDQADEAIEPVTEPFLEVEYSSTTLKIPTTTPWAAQYFFFNTSPPRKPTNFEELPQPTLENFQNSTPQPPDDLQVFTSTPQPTLEPALVRNAKPSKYTITYEYNDEPSFFELEQVYENSQIISANSRDNSQRELTPENFEKHIVVKDLIKQNSHKNVKFIFLFIWKWIKE